MPRQVVDGDVQMPDPWRDVAGARPEHRYDAEVLRPVWDQDGAPGQRVGKRGATISLGAGSFSMGKNGEAARTSLALWANTLMARCRPVGPHGPIRPSCRLA
jgi:hypothetical protein